jgi:aminoglycoside/choline kinase family phosphotransferase
VENLNDQEILCFAREALGLSGVHSLELSLLAKRGSDRAFYRLKWDEEDSAILIHYDPERLENTYYAEIATFLRGIDVSVPQLIRHDRARSLILIEDLGDTDLWSFREASWESRRILYQKTLTTVHKLHSFPRKEFPSDRVKLMEGFGPELYRREWNYFRDHFVRDVCGIELESGFERQLEEELSVLSENLLQTGECLIHRDLQSQNVMIRAGEPFLIDFQGMRFGSPFYDLGSLLCDPYVHFSDSQRAELLLFYFELSGFHFDWETFLAHFWRASAERLMQALGAYGFLGLKRGLTSYFEHIPAGLQNLDLTLAKVPAFFRLRELSSLCRRAIAPEPKSK